MASKWEPHPAPPDSDLCTDLWLILTERLRVLSNSRDRSSRGIRRPFVFTLYSARMHGGHALDQVPRKILCGDV